MDFGDRKTYFVVQCSVVLAYVGHILRRRKRNEHPPRLGIAREPSNLRDAWRLGHMYQILLANGENCITYCRMSTGLFYTLVHMMRDRQLLEDTANVPVEEQVAMTLHMLGHKAKNRVCRIEFVRSGETVSRYFHKVLQAISAIRNDVMQQPGVDTPEEILHNEDWFPYFKDCMGMIDGTHVEVTVPAEDAGRFRGRKDKLTQNVLAACIPNKMFTYVLAGWEGSANDFAVLKDALSMPPPAGLKVITGKYYLVDVGYTTMPGFIAPYRGVRYHLNQHIGRTPQNPKELFNYRHSSLRTKIEGAFGTLKNRFKILEGIKYHPYKTQVDIVLACTVLHNFILGGGPPDMYVIENLVVEPGITPNPPDLFSYEQYSQLASQQEQRTRKKEWEDKRDAMAQEMWVEYRARPPRAN